MNNAYYKISEVANLLSVSKDTLRRWDNSGKLTPIRHPINNYRVYHKDQLMIFEEFQRISRSNWESEERVSRDHHYTSIEIFAGCGGLALGLKYAGFEHLLLNEIDKKASTTLQNNIPSWNVINDDIHNVCFKEYKHKVDLLSGGFPCQAFSYAGNKMGFNDTRGTLFFEFARAVKEIEPKMFLAENVRGLMNHDNGRTLSTIKSVIYDIGYTLVEPKVLKAIYYKVPQKRERLFLIGIRNDLYNDDLFRFPDPYHAVLTMKDALKKGVLYSCDVPLSLGQKYPDRKKEILNHVPPGGCWRNLPVDLQKEYMQKSFYLGGGKTGMARRLSWDEPSLTLTCAPAQKQTERCHPEETRPLTVREYARIQTFPDNWQFYGSISSQYKQIGNAVPVNLAATVGRSLIRALNKIYQAETNKLRSP